MEGHLIALTTVGFLKFFFPFQLCQDSLPRENHLEMTLH